MLALFAELWVRLQEWRAERDAQRARAARTGWWDRLVHGILIVVFGRGLLHERDE